jgi:hypothetical protein
MEDYPITHAKQVNPFFPVVFTVVNPLNKKVIVERLNGLLEGDSMVTPVRGSLVIIPYKLYHLEYRLSVVVSSVQFFFSCCLKGFQGGPGEP